MRDSVGISWVGWWFLACFRCCSRISFCIVESRHHHCCAFWHVYIQFFYTSTAAASLEVMEITDPENFALLVVQQWLSEAGHDEGESRQMPISGCLPYLHHLSAVLSPKFHAHHHRHSSARLFAAMSSGAVAFGLTMFCALLFQSNLAQH